MKRSFRNGRTWEGAHHARLGDTSGQARVGSGTASVRCGATRSSADLPGHSRRAGIRHRVRLLRQEIAAGSRDEHWTADMAGTGSGRPIRRRNERARVEATPAAERRKSRKERVTRRPDSHTGSAGSFGWQPNEHPLKPLINKGLERPPKKSRRGWTRITSDTAPRSRRVDAAQRASALPRSRRTPAPPPSHSSRHCDARHRRRLHRAGRRPEPTLPPPETSICVSSPTLCVARPVAVMVTSHRRHARSWSRSAPTSPRRPPCRPSTPGRRTPPAR